MSTKNDTLTVDDKKNLQSHENDSLKPNTEKDRTLGPFGYMSMWVGDGVNMGNMTLGASIIVLGVATLNAVQTFAAALVAIGIISINNICIK